MRRIATLFLIVISGIASAQIPNPGFEAWTGSGASLLPAGWNDLNGFLAGSTVKSSTAHSGKYSAELTSVLSSGIYFGGVISTGTISNPYFGTGLSSNPSALTGWYQLQSVGGDQLQVIVRARVTDSSNFTGSGSTYYNTTVAVWKQFSICLKYTGGTTDSASIIFELVNSTGNGAPTNAGSYILIDDLAWGVCGAGIEDINSDVSLEPSYPNPASYINNIIYSIPRPANVSVGLYDLNGRKVINILNNTYQTPGRYKIPVDISSFENGVYLYTVVADGVSYTQKLVVAK